MFLHPDKFKEDYEARRIVEYKSKDTLLVEFENTHIPHFRLPVDDIVPEIESIDININSLFIPNGNKDSLNAWMLAPKDSTNGTMILFLHGNAGNVVSQFQSMTPFVRKGYQALVLDYSGFGFSTGRPTRRNVLKDANMAFDYIVADTSLVYERLIIYGQSLGGHVAVVVAEENQDYIDGLVIEGAFSSHKDVGADMAGVMARIFVKEGYSAKDSFRGYYGPTLIIHSEEDKMIPLAHAETLNRVARNPKTFLKIDGRHINGPILYADTISSLMEGL
jgi:pimeloyl-ACP methyl ester carboxylesterase